MPLKTLSFNQGVLRQNIRSLSWIGIIYFLVLLFILPLQFILTYENEQTQYQHHQQNLFAMMDPIQAFTMFIVPVLLAMVLFRYLHIKGQADFLHSLPIKRKELYIQNVLYGMFILVVPVLLTGILLILFYDTIHVLPTISVGEIWNWIGVTILFNLLVFFIGVFVAMVTGISAVHAVITYILFVLPVGVFSLSVFNIQYLLFGFSSEYYLNSNIERLVPFVRASELSQLPLTGKEALAYAAVTIMFAVLALIIYKYRKIESAQQPIAFRNLQPLFKYGVAFCSLLVGGFYFGESKNQIGWIIFGMVATSLIGYFVAEMVLAKTWRVFKKWKGYVFFLTAFAVIGLLFNLMGAKYEQKLPNLSEVERVYLGDSIFFLKEDLNRRMYDYDTNDSIFLKEKNNMDLVYKFHKEIINNQDTLEGIPSYNTRSIAIGYEMENGKMLVRDYQIPIELYNEYFKEIVVTEEYKYNHFPLLRFKEVNEIKSISFYRDGPIQTNVVIADPAKISEFATILQEEIRNENADSILKSQESWATIELFVTSKKQMNVSWKKSYEKVDAWLKKNGLLQDTRITSEAVSKMIVAVKDEKNYDVREMQTTEELLSSLEKKENTLIITNKVQIEESLKNAFWYENSDYLVGIYFKDEKYRPMIQSFSKDSLPEFVREHFQ